jgi:hypothetical protein
MTTTWDVKPISIKLTKNNGDELILKVGQFIIYNGREYGVKIEEFTYNKDDDGPIGMIYIPWRGDKWADIVFSISRGNLRHIICYPYGYIHYGIHIKWYTVELVNNGVCPSCMKSFTPT